MHDWYEYGEVLSDEEYARLLEEQLTAHEQHLNPGMARNLRAMGAAVIEWRGEGPYLIDPRGRRFYDCMGAGGVFGLGHNHPEVVAAVRRQLDRGAALSTRVGLVPAQASLAERLVAKAPGKLPFCYFGSTGTEAVEVALKLARLTTRRGGFVGMKNGYHGMSVASLSVSGLDYWRHGFPPLLSQVALVPFMDVAALEQAMSDKVAAVVLEVVQWASGCTVASPDYLRKVRALCDQHGALMIVDEIQSGLGRAGRWWALEESGVQPDLLCVGKVLSGGMIPISAVLYTPAIRAVEDTRPLFNNSTFGGGPLACAAAVATLDVLEQEKLVERSAHLGELLERGFDRVCREFPQFAVGHRGIGLMRCLRTASTAIGLVVQEMMRDDHACLVTSMIHTPEVIRVSPAFVSTDAEVKKLVDSFHEVFAHLQKIGLVGIQAYLQELITRLNRATAAPTTAPTG